MCFTQMQKKSTGPHVTVTKQHFKAHLSKTEGSWADMQKFARGCVILLNLGEGSWADMQKFARGCVILLNLGKQKPLCHSVHLQFDN